METEPVAFERLVVRVNAGTEIGHHHDGLAKVRQYPYRWQDDIAVASDDFRVYATESLRDAGYDVLGGDDLVFRRDDSSKARYRIGGVVTGLTLDTYGKLAGDYAESSLTVQWQVLDALRDQVVMETTETGRAREPASSTAALKQAFRSALRGLLADQTFVDLITVQRSVASESPDEALYSAHCPEPVGSALPAGLEELFRATVVLRPGQTTGSGVIISEQGHTLTAAHVVSQLQRVPVILREGLQLEATVLSIDEAQDLALIQLPGSGYSCVTPLGARLPVGSDVFAIGSPTGEELSYSVSRGIVSGYRNVDGFNYLQTDASLNPGNSGGPLFDAGGNLVGVVSWKIVGLNVEGLAFGVPMDVVRQSLSVELTGDPQP